MALLREKTLKHTLIHTYFKLFHALLGNYLNSDKKAPHLRSF